MIKRAIITISIITLYSCTSIPKYSNNTYENTDKYSTKQTKIIEKEPYIRVNISSNHENYRGSIYYSNNYKINEVLLEEYLYSVVGAEMPSSFNIEALKAQAVAARTYAINNIFNPKNANFDLYDTVRSQAYKGRSSESEKVKKAVDETRGIVAKYDGKIIDALYHSSAGSRTISALAYYGNEVAYLQEVEDFTQDKTWTKNITKSQFMKDFSIENFEEIIDLKNILMTNETSISKRKIKEKYALRSSNFNIEVLDNSININGVGFGHGVGMSQYGANELSKKGYNYEYILKHYYTGINLDKIY